MRRARLPRTLPLALAAATLAGCGSFEDPDVVLDLRVLAIRAGRPEQVVDVDLDNPPAPTDLLAQLQPTDACALIADPASHRRLRWSATLCNLDNADRCADDHPQIALGAGLWDDPDDTPGEPPMCVAIPADADLLAVLIDALQDDPLHGLGGLTYGVSLRVGGEGDAPADDLYAAKTLQVQPRIPADRTANQNPFLDGIDALPEDATTPQPLALVRCGDQAAPLEVAPGQKVRLSPVEPDGVRETYDVPTLDGQARTFTESLTYQWLASAGSFSKGSTGGPRDAFGNPAPLFSDWKAPAAEDLDGPTDVTLWVIQRDERLGVQWYESCVRVVP